MGNSGHLSEGGQEATVLGDELSPFLSHSPSWIQVLKALGSCCWYQGVKSSLSHSFHGIGPIWLDRCSAPFIISAVNNICPTPADRPMSWRMNEPGIGSAQHQIHGADTLATRSFQTSLATSVQHQAGQKLGKRLDFLPGPRHHFCHLQKYTSLYLGSATNGPPPHPLFHPSSRMFLRLFLSFNIFFLPPGEVIKHSHSPTHFAYCL
ncbi:PREDICTED: uncharacterized protein LOC106147918 [Chinchilla lanigera]|uniref:uncharacterized protein LOC106147918 n=1 Tax=Chinchilla lanigera TaxID=34839 RepID=UPI0006964D80|nr:PREDICTED: uncharacterized protein LOC106147918 [Chinchilla lanigera]